MIPGRLEDVLRANGFAHVATIGPDGEPQNNPVRYAWDGGARHEFLLEPKRPMRSDRLQQTLTSSQRHLAPRAAAIVAASPALKSANGGSGVSGRRGGPAGSR